MDLRKKYSCKKSLIHGDKLRVMTLLLPGLIMLGMFTFYPIIKMFIMSFFDWKIGFNQQSEFVGLANYIAVFTDKYAKTALVNTVFYGGVTIPMQMILGLLVALLINKITKFSVTYRLFYYLPVITSWVVVALLFRYIFNNEGLLNYFITDVIKISKEPIGWLGKRWTALSATTILGIWKGIGWNMVVFLAALQSVPKEYYEASSMDGINAWQQFFHITLPCIKGTVLFVLVMLIIGAFNTYTPIAVITGGNPAHQTDVVLTWMYSQTFNSLKFGYSAAFSFIIALAIAIMAVLLFWVLAPQKEEE